MQARPVGAGPVAVSRISISYMPELVRLRPRHHRSFLSFWDELLAADEDAPNWLNWGDDRGRDELADPAEFAHWCDYLDFLPVEPLETLPPDRVRSTIRYLADGDEVLSRVSIRHGLTDHLLQVGGHIGYTVRPTQRRQGYAKQTLAEALRIAAELGLTQALVTCHDDNIGSARTIEANGGVLEDIREGTRRYWVPTQH